MNVTTVTAGAADFRLAVGKFFLPGAAEFAGGLNLGQIIKGKVMRQFDDGGGRYLVNFGGQERVVDSAVPLTTGELIYGRVIGLGDRVELQRVHPAESDAAKVAQPGDVAQVRAGSFGRNEQVLNEFVTRFRVSLNNDDRAVLARATRMAGDTTAMTMVGVMVNKLGLRQSPELLWPAYHALLREDSSSAALFRGVEAPELQVVAGADAGSAAVATTVRQLADAIARQFDQKADEKPHNPVAEGIANNNTAPAAISTAVPSVSQRGDDDANAQHPARWLLNVQTEGTVAHRIGTVPILVGDRLVEVDLSFFEQRQSQQLSEDTKHRKVVFSLRTEGLGTVEVVAGVSGKHLRLRIATADQDATRGASGYAQELRAALSAGGWEVDEIAYETRQGDSQNGVVRSVVEHVIAQDSLNHLV